MDYNRISILIMSDRHSILLLILLLPAMALGQTIHFEKDRVAYKGKMENTGTGKADSYHKAKEILLTIVQAPIDSLKENKEEKELIASATLRLPSSKYQETKTVDYKMKLKPGENEIKYEIGDIKLNIRERGKKGKTLHAEEILKGMEEHGKVAVLAEKELNEIDMHIQRLIASMQSQLQSTQHYNNQ